MPSRDRKRAVCTTHERRLEEIKTGTARRIRKHNHKCIPQLTRNESHCNVEEISLPGLGDKLRMNKIDHTGKRSSC